MRLLARTLSLLTILAAAIPAHGQAQDLYRCTKVIDGDTIELETIGRVRLIGVDCPEAGQRPVGPEGFADEASAFTRALVEGKPVWLEYEKQRTDKYDRTLAYVFLEDSTFVNAAIITLGYGYAYTTYPFRYADWFRRLESEARRAQRGIWEPARLRAGLQAGLPAAGLRARQEPGNDGVVVYVTRTGKKYHREGCRYLARSMIPMALSDAALQYGPCSVCGPPILAPSTSSGSSSSAYQRRPSAPTSRCQATTKKGTQCKRNAKAGSSYCWQHGG